mgnify:FL=1|jgi:hypothetical protein
MCELLNKYLEEVKLEGEIEGFIEGLLLYDIEEFFIIKRLMYKYNLTKDEAKQKLAEYKK